MARLHRLGRSALALASALVLVAATESVAVAAAPAAATQSLYATWASGAIESAQPTYVVSGRMATAYKKAGGKKKMGLPTAKARCGLPERGCLQRFQKGVLYLQRNGRVWRTGMTGQRGEILAVARSQVGFKQTNLKKKTKYSIYTGEVATRWCNDFHSWVAYAAGYPKLLPKIPNYETMKKWMRKHYKRLSTPKRGAYVILNGSKYQSHMAMVWQVHSKRSITILEGNWGRSVMMRRISVAKSMDFRWQFK